MPVIIIFSIFGHLLIDYLNINKSFLAFETNNLQNIILGILTVYIPFILLFLTNIKKKIKFDALILLYQSQLIMHYLGKIFL